MDVNLNKLAVALTMGAGIISAFCWVKSASVEVAARPGTVGVGAVLGGDIVIENTAGNRIDLIDTLSRQSKWNRWAAVFAAIATGAQVVATLSI